MNQVNAENSNKEKENFAKFLTLTMIAAVFIGGILSIAQINKETEEKIALREKTIAELKTKYDEYCQKLAGEKGFQYNKSISIKTGLFSSQAQCYFSNKDSGQPDEIINIPSLEALEIPYIKTGN